MNYVLDGQQRLATIYAVFCKDRHEAPDNNQYNLDPKIFDIYFDLEEEKFVVEEDLIVEHANLKLSSLFDIEKFYEEVEKLDGNNRKLAIETALKNLEEEEVLLISGKGDEEYQEYKGKKYYLCCRLCQSEFEKDPEKYIKKN